MKGNNSKYIDRITNSVKAKRIFIFLFFFFFLVFPNSEGKTQTMMEKLTQLQKELLACKSNPACMAKVMKKMEALTQSMQIPGAIPFSPQGQAGGFPIPITCDLVKTTYFYLGDYDLCVPVNITISDTYVEESYAFISSGVMPGPSKRYTTRHFIFSYSTEAKGVLLYDKDFSRFQMITENIPEKLKIRKLEGYVQNTDQDNKILRRDFNLGGAFVRNKNGLTIQYPMDYEYVDMADTTTNVEYGSPELETHDDWIPTFAGSTLIQNTELSQKFIVTPPMMRDLVESQSFNKNFRWRHNLMENYWIDCDVQINIEIGEPCEEEIILAIVPDSNDKRYCYSADDPGVLTMEFTADVSPAVYTSDVEWTLPEIKGSQRKIDPPDAKGKKVTVTYTGLPIDNSEFGKIKVSAKIDQGNCKASDEEEVEVFYFRDEKNNPEGKYPNWFYYWKQTPAANPLGTTVNIEWGGVFYDLCTQSNVPAIFVPTGPPNTIHICDMVAKLGAKFVLGYPKVNRKIPSTLKNASTVEVQFIDAFAVAIIHEFQHMKNHEAWWRGKTEAYSTTNDKDADGIPDFLEKAMGFDPSMFQTYFATHPQFKNIGGDEEFTAYEAMYGYQPGVYDKYDWALPGKNWVVK